MTDGSGATTRRLLGELEQSGIRLGLDAMTRLLAALGSPHLRLPHVLVAGTNGKGSTAVQLHAILAAAGYRTGLYTSPHLENVRERLRIDGRAIGAAELSVRLQRVVAVAESELGGRPTYFEALTAVAFDYFADEVDIAVLEVGLGGRLDATNVGEPILSLVTEIGLDHVELLGATESAIAREKAGIMRRGRSALAAVTSVGRSELERWAREVGAHWVDALAGTEVEELDARTLRVTTAAGAYRLAPRLPGAHQTRNLVLAIRAAEVLAASGWRKVTSKAIVAGIEGSCWPGRLERIEIEGGREILLDAAHNPQGAATLADYLDRRPATTCLLFGALADKDVAGLLAPLASRVERLVLTAPRTPRAQAPEALLDLVGDCPAQVESDVEAALALALGGDEPRIVVCGSIYLIGDVRRLVRRRCGRPVAAVDLDLTGGAPAP